MSETVSGAPVASVAALVEGRLDAMTRAERQVAELLLADPEAVAFGTVAEVAARCGASGATVVRCAVRLGFDGYPQLQDAVQTELRLRLRPATERIRESSGSGDDTVEAALQMSLASVKRSLQAVDGAAFSTAVDALAAPSRVVHVLCGDDASGVGAHFVTRLSMLREGVRIVAGSPVALGRQLAAIGSGDVVLAVDLRRYDQWLLDALDVVRDRGAALIALTDSPVSPVAIGATAVFVVTAEGPRPFDSYVGVLALLDALVSGVAQLARPEAADHLDAIEQIWRQSGALRDPAHRGGID